MSYGRDLKKSMAQAALACMRSQLDRGRLVYQLVVLVGLGLTLLVIGPGYAAPFAYIGQGRAMSIIDTATHAVVATVSGLMAEPSAVAVHPKGTFVYVANTRSSTVSVVDTARNTVLTSVGVGFSFPSGIAVHPAGTFVYVANFVSSAVSVMDTATNTVIATIPVGAGDYDARGVAVHPRGSFIYVTNPRSKTLSVVDTTTNALILTVPVGADPRGVAVHPKGSFVYVCNGWGSTLSVIASATNTAIATIPVGTGPTGVAVHPAGTFVYVTNYNSSTVSVIDTVTNTVVATVPIGTFGSWPAGVAVHPTGTSVYVVKEGDRTVDVIDTATNMVIATISMAWLPQASGQFIGPAVILRPTLTLTLTGCTRCRPGDRLTVQAHVVNPETIRVEAKVGVRMPSGQPTNLVGKHLEVSLPADLDTTLTIFDAPVPLEIPTGTWTFEGVLLEPELGTILSRHTQAFEVLP